MEGIQNAVREYDNSYVYNGFDQQSQEFIDQILRYHGFVAIQWL